LFCWSQIQLLAVMYKSEDGAPLEDLDRKREREREIERERERER